MYTFNTLVTAFGKRPQLEVEKSRVSGNIPPVYWKQYGGMRGKRSARINEKNQTSWDGKLMPYKVCGGDDLFRGRRSDNLSKILLAASFIKRYQPFMFYLTIMIGRGMKSQERLSLSAGSMTIWLLLVILVTIKITFKTTKRIVKCHIYLTQLMAPELLSILHQASTHPRILNSSSWSWVNSTKTDLNDSW